MKPLPELPCRESAELRDLGTDPVLAQRLMALGVMPGQAVSVQHRVPFRGPLLFRFALGKLGIRHHDAGQLSVD